MYGNCRINDGVVWGLCFAINHPFKAQNFSPFILTFQLKSAIISIQKSGVGEVLPAPLIFSRCDVDCVSAEFMPLNIYSMIPV